LLTSLAVLLVLMAAAIGFGGPTDRSLGP
jgi:hypothetical protein